MAKYYHSDYALNKNSDAILYRTADGTVVEVTKEDYLAQNPNLTEEQFYELKELSDEMFKEEKNVERKEQRKKNKEQQHLQSEFPPLSYEEKMIVNEEREKIRTVTNQLLASGKLSEKQERRFIAHYYEGKSTRQIAKVEGVTQRAVWDSLYWARKKLKKLYSN